MTADDTQNYKLDQLNDSVKLLTQAVERLTTSTTETAGEVKTLRRDYNRIPGLEKEVNQIERELAANRVWIKLLGTGVTAALLGLVGAITQLVLK